MVSNRNKYREYQELNGKRKVNDVIRKLISVMLSLPHLLQQSVCVWVGGGSPGWYKEES